MEESRRSATPAPAGRPPVLFLHALAGNAGQWRSQIEHLMPDRLALGVDLPGHGVSDLPEEGDCAPAAMADEVSAVIDALGLPPPVLVGHSYGAAVAIALAGARPANVAGVVLVDPAGDMRLEPEEAIAAFLDMLAPETYERAIASHYQDALRGCRPAVRRSVLESLARTPRGVVVKSLEALARFDPATPLLGFPGPMLSVIAEQHDGPAALHRLVEALPVEGVSGASHWLHMDRPAAFNAILDAFLARVDEQG